VKLSTFVEVFVVALYNETAITGNSSFDFGQILDRYSLNMEPAWQDRILQDHQLQAYVDISRHDGPIRDQRVALSLAGFRWAEDNFGENAAQFLEAHGAVYDAPTEQASEKPVVLSSTWTGLPSNFELNEQKRAALVSMLDEAERALDSVGAGNSEKAMARAYIVAARALSDAPDPPADLIWEIIQRANSLAGIASLFVSIVALFAAAAH
jgi:hypothetical protein